MNQEPIPKVSADIPYHCRDPRKTARRLYISTITLLAVPLPLYEVHRQSNTVYLMPTFGIGSRAQNTRVLTLESHSDIVSTLK